MNSQLNTKHRALGLLLLAFIAPVLLAKLVLSLNWYHGGATNHGELFSQEISYSSLGVSNPIPKEWQLLYLLPAQCDADCLERLYILQQSHTALGPDQDRVSPVILLDKNSDQQALTSFHFATRTVDTNLQSLLNEQQLILVDPLGSLVLRYPQVKGNDAQLAQGKALLADLRKLLKLSRVD
ncbi:hypothetical protein [Shewanella acanthi]|uniref:hypothetical protein n=1 Tax=Shewanella acanthi TaxID=2864212 RepID=UPI001C657A65|nr:hypothetical protein [Shewanella acanthi]QYJ78703.1 hypothetical protein K0H61_16750 [Shewanella acanthi]